VPAGPDPRQPEPAAAPFAPGSGAGGSWFHTVAAWNRRINRALGLLSAGLIVGIVVLTLYEIVSRYGFNAPTTWTFPVCSYLLLYVIYTSTAYALQEGAHVQVSVIVERLPARARHVVDVVAGVLGLAFVVVLLWQVTRFTEIAFRLGSRDLSMLSVPLTLTTTIMPIGTALLCITYVVLIVERLLAPPAPGTPAAQRT
jgi:TRAP-type C4-dicarboxylate transport system permease small subunit